MKYIHNLLFVLAGLFLAIIISCSGGKQIVQMQQEATSAYTSGDYEKALQSFENIINQQKNSNKEVDPETYKQAGFAAWELKKTNTAMDYLEQVRKTSGADAKTFFILALIYKEVNNLSKEITCLETYSAQYPLGDEIKIVKSKLFIAYVESENWDSANRLWNSLDERDKTSLINLHAYLKVLIKIEDKDQSEKIAKQILKSDANDILALQVLAEKYYYKAENRYQEEMTAYENKKNNKQYQILLKALKEINEDFKVSRDYFLKLYKLSPEPRYATLLGNIFIRFDNKEKADYYYKLGKKK